jgi:hypothetical protein
MAYSPIHRTMDSGSVRYRYTTAGGAVISIEV